MSHESKIHMGIVSRLALYLLMGYMLVACSGGTVCSWIGIGVFLGLLAFELVINHSLEGIRKLSYLACAALICLAALILAYQAHAAQLVR